MPYIGAPSFLAHRIKILRHYPPVFRLSLPLAGPFHLRIRMRWFFLPLLRGVLILDPKDRRAPEGDLDAFDYDDKPTAKGLTKDKTA